MAKSKLNQRQEKFCREVVKNGGNATKAYKDAGYVATDDDTANANASRLIASDKVQERLRELRAPEEEEDIMSIKERRQKLTAIVRDSELSAQDWMKAIDLLNKMDSLYLQRQEVTGAVPVTIIEDVPEND